MDFPFLFAYSNATDLKRCGLSKEMWIAFELDERYVESFEYRWGMSFLYHCFVSDVSHHPPYLIWVNVYDDSLKHHSLPWSLIIRGAHNGASLCSVRPLKYHNDTNTNNIQPAALSVSALFHHHRCTNEYNNRWGCANIKETKECLYVFQRHVNKHELVDICEKNGDVFTLLGETCSHCNTRRYVRNGDSYKSIVTTIILKSSLTIDERNMIKQKLSRLDEMCSRCRKSFHE